MALFRNLDLDLRTAWRAILRRPAYAATVAATLALGLAAASVVFSLIDHLLLRPVPGVAEAHRAVEIGRTERGEGFDTFSWPEVEDLEALDVFSSVSVVKSEQVSVQQRPEAGDPGPPGTQRRPAILVSPAYFQVLGLAPAKGRFFTPDEGQPRDPRQVVVVSHRFWQRELVADPGVVGSALRVNRKEFTVVGVAPRDFRGHDALYQPDLYLPTGALAHVAERLVELTSPAAVQAGEDNGNGGAAAINPRRSSWLRAVARLAPGVSVEQADAAAMALFSNLRDSYPDIYEERGVRVMEMRSAPAGVRSRLGLFLVLLLALSGILVAVSCASVSGLFLARTAGRRREMAVRLAIGSGRGRLVRQLLVELCILFAIGAGLGFWLSLGAMDTLIALLPEMADRGMPRVEVAPDLRVFGFALVVALVSGVATGVLPALRASRPQIVPALKSGDEASAPSSRRGAGVGRLRRVFVSAQVALTLLLLVTSGLLVRSLHNSGRAELAIRTDGVATASLDLANDGYDDEAGRELMNRFLERASALPGIAEVALTNDLPLNLGRKGTAVYLPSKDGSERTLGVEFAMVTAGYFRALDLTLWAGRGFATGDTAEAPPVAVVSRKFIADAWPEANVGEALGRRLRFGAPDAPWATVVGIVDDVANSTFGESPEPMVYVAWEQNYAPRVNLVVRATNGSAGATAATRGAVDALRRLDPDLAVGPIRDLRQITNLSRTPQRLATGVATTLGLLALVLSALGIYGVVAYAAVQRRREVGIRLALGAEPRQILRGVLRRELVAVFPALAAGLVLAHLAARALRGLLYGVGPSDPLALTAAAGVLLAAILTAALLPARRSAATDPAEALRGS